jgi:hypothetical protein
VTTRAGSAERAREAGRRDDVVDLLADLGPQLADRTGNGDADAFAGLSRDVAAVRDCSIGAWCARVAAVPPQPPAVHPIRLQPSAGGATTVSGRR